MEVECCSNFRCHWKTPAEWRKEKTSKCREIQGSREMSNTLQISISNDAWEHHVLSSLRRLQRDDVLCDAVLVTEDGHTSRAHAVMLAASSPVLYKLITASSPQHKLHLHQVPQQKVMQHILDFIYEGQITIPIKLLYEVQKAAEKLCINQLSDVCLRILQEMGITNTQKEEKATSVQHTPPTHTNGCVLKVPSVRKISDNTQKGVSEDLQKVGENGQPVEKVTENISTLKVKQNGQSLQETSLVKVENLSRNSGKFPVHSEENEQAIDLSIVKTENVSSPCDTSDKTAVSEVSRRYDSRYSTSALNNSNTNCPMQPGFCETRQNYTPGNSECDEKNVPSYPSSNEVKSDAGDLSISLSEEDDLVEEMVAEQLLQSRMHRGQAKRDKGMKRFHCRICDNRFTRLDNLRVHIRSIHSGRKPFKCNQCDKMFTRAFTLKYHKMSHDGIKPWTCADCGRGFTRKDYHQDHIRNQICKKNKSEKSAVPARPASRTSSPSVDAHQCQMCDSFFPSQELLEIHMENCLEESHDSRDSHGLDIMRIDHSENCHVQDAEISHTENAENSHIEDAENSHIEDAENSHVEDAENECICQVCHTRFLDLDSLEVHQWEHKRQDSQKIEMVAPHAPDLSPDKYTSLRQHGNRRFQEDSDIKSPGSPDIDRDSPLSCGDLKDKPGRKVSSSSSLRELLCDEESQLNIQARQCHFQNDNFQNSQFSVLDLRKSSFQSDENENLTSDLNLQGKSVYPLMFTGKDISMTHSTQENLDKIPKDLKLNKRPFEGYSNENMLPSNSYNVMNMLPVVFDNQTYQEPVKKRSKQDRPFCCDICQARFTRSDNMRVHRRRHFNAAKMFSCPECGQAFTRSSSLKTHMGAAHKHT